MHVIFFLRFLELQCAGNEIASEKAYGLNGHTVMSKPLDTISAWTFRPIYERTSLHRKVIDEVPDAGLRNAYHYCRQITRNYAKTFYYATRFLPHHKQRSIFAIYALCRSLDNLVDDAADAITTDSAKRKVIADALIGWEDNLEKAYQGNPTKNPVLMAFSDVLKRLEIPITLPLELIDGVRMDLFKNRYNSFDELYGYSYKVASVVGLMISEVFGYEDKSALPCAVDLGIAMQLTNILRDVGEDLQRGRIYLPAEDLKRFNITEKDLENHRVTEDFIELMKFQIGRARSYYEKADQGIPKLSQDSRVPVYLARYNYARILDQIEANGYQVFTRRAYLTFTQKMSLIPRLWWENRSH